MTTRVRWVEAGGTRTRAPDGTGVRTPTPTRHAALSADSCTPTRAPHGAVSGHGPPVAVRGRVAPSLRGCAARAARRVFGWLRGSVAPYDGRGLRGWHGGWPAASSSMIHVETATPGAYPRSRRAGCAGRSTVGAAAPGGGTISFSDSECTLWLICSSARSMDGPGGSTVAPLARQRYSAGCKRGASGVSRSRPIRWAMSSTRDLT